MPQQMAGLSHRAVRSRRQKPAAGASFLDRDVRQCLDLGHFAGTLFPY